MSAPWTLVMRREVAVKMRDKAFLIGTLATVAMIAGFLVFQGWMGQRTTEVALAVTPQSQPMGQLVAGAASQVDDKVKINLVEVRDDAAAERLVRDKEVEAWLHEGDDGWVLTTESSAEDELHDVAQAVIRSQLVSERATAAGTSIGELEAGTTLQEEFLRGDAERSQIADVVGFAFVFLFYMAALIFGMQLANSVVEEKQSRIAEIIASSIPVRHLLAGKVIGNTVLALIQMTLYAAVGLIGMSFTSYADFVPDISGPVAWFLAFFVAGFLALACLWAVAGALASRTEDLQSTSMPLTMLILVIFFGGLMLDGRAVTVASYIPPISAVLMPKRIIEGGVAWWEPLLALGLLAAFALVTVVVAERVYRRALLQTQGQISLRQAWAASE
ncbi:MAG: ABC transporter permease [Nocardioides sp.]